MYLNFRALPMLMSNVKCSAKLGTQLVFANTSRVCQDFRAENASRLQFRKRAASLISLEERESCEADGRACLQVRPLPVVE
jgi:hypothetical protein